MAKLTKSEVAHIAKLSKLELTEKEVEKFSSQLSAILDFFNELKKVDVSGIEPTSQTTGLENVYADDVIKPEFALTVDEATSGSSTENNLFVVPMLLTQRSDK